MSHQDKGGSPFVPIYHAPPTKAPGDGQPVKIPDGSGGYKEGTLRDGYAVPNKK